MCHKVYILLGFCYTNNGQTTKVLSHSYVIGLHEVYNFVKFCKYDWFLGGRVLLIFFFCNRDVGSFFGRSGAMAYFIIVLESLKIIISVTQRSRTFQLTSHTLYFSAGVTDDVSCECFSFDIQELPQKVKNTSEFESG